MLLVDWFTGISPSSLLKNASNTQSSATHSCEMRFCLVELLHFHKNCRAKFEIKSSINSLLKPFRFVPEPNRSLLW
jgi:hypothetical protein